MSPKELIRQWVECFNSGSAIDIAEFYHVDAINHQVANSPVVGKQAIDAGSIICRPPSTDTAGQDDMRSLEVVSDMGT